MAPPKDSPSPRTRSGKSQDNQAPRSPPNPSSITPNVPPTDTSQPDMPSTATAPQVLAAIPMVTPLSTNPQALASYGTFNNYEPTRYVHATIPQLKEIIATAPPAVRKQLPSNVNKDAYLNEVLRLRQHEAIHSILPDTAPDNSLSKLMSLSPQDILDMSQSDPTQLQSLMHAALVADQTLSPRNFSLFDPGRMAGTAMTWLFNCCKEAKDLHQTTALPVPSPPEPRRVRFGQQEQIIPPPTIQPPLVTDLATLLDMSHCNEPGPSSSTPHGGHSAATDSSDDSDSDTGHQAKKQKSYANPQNFSYGAGSAVPQLLRSYPGIQYSSRSLNVNHMLGPKILASWIAQGNDVPTFLFHFKWKPTTAGMPTQSQMEAHTLGRMIHLEILACGAPQKAIDTRPSLAADSGVYMPSST